MPTEEYVADGALGKGKTRSVDLDSSKPRKKRLIALLRIIGGIELSGAACRDIDNPDIFFPDDWPPERKDEVIEAAKIVCEECAVREDCKKVGLDLERIGPGRNRGIWGGLTEKERDDELAK